MLTNNSIRITNPRAYIGTGRIEFLLGVTGVTSYIFGGKRQDLGQYGSVANTRSAELPEGPGGDEPAKVAPPAVEVDGWWRTLVAALKTSQMEPNSVR